MAASWVSPTTNLRGLQLQRVGAPKSVLLRPFSNLDPVLIWTNHWFSGYKWRLFSSGVSTIVILMVASALSVMLHPKAPGPISFSPEGHCQEPPPVRVSLDFTSHLPFSPTSHPPQLWVWAQATHITNRKWTQMPGNDTLIRANSRLLINFLLQVLHENDNSLAIMKCSFICNSDQNLDRGINYTHKRLKIELGSGSINAVLWWEPKASDQDFQIQTLLIALRNKETAAQKQTCQSITMTHNKTANGTWL